jgi:hypothetical protein
LFGELERRYAEACAGHAFGMRSCWPKRGYDKSKAATADDLVNFAYEEDLTLAGEKRPAEE